MRRSTASSAGGASAGRGMAVCLVADRWVIERPALLETPAAEQHRVRQVLQTAAVHHPFKIRQYFLAGLAVDHAIEIVAPRGQAPRAAVAERDEIEAGEAASERRRMVVGHVPHHHSVGAVTNLVV